MHTIKPNKDEVYLITKASNIFKMMLYGLVLHHEGNEYALDLRGELYIKMYKIQVNENLELSNKEEVWLQAILGGCTLTWFYEIAKSVSEDEYSKMMMDFGLNTYRPIHERNLEN